MSSWDRKREREEREDTGIEGGWRDVLDWRWVSNLQIGEILLTLVQPHMPTHTTQFIYSISKHK